MQTQKQQRTNSFSRRIMLRGLAGFVLTLSLDGCVQANSSPATASPTAHPQSPGSLLKSYRGHTMRVTSVAWSPNGQYIASGSLDKTVQVWAADSGDHRRPFIYRGHAAGVNAVAWSPNSQQVVSGAADARVDIWNAHTGEQAIHCSGHTDAVTTVAWSPDGNTVASGSADGTVRLWDAATGTQRLVYRGHTGSINSVCWSPNSLHLASGSADTTVQILDVATGKRILTYRGHTATVSSVSWSPNGTHLASGSWDKTVQVWDAATGKVAYVYNGYNVKAAITDSSKGVLPDLIFVVAWSHHGKRLAAVTQVYCGDDCGVVISWDAETGRNLRFYIDTPVFALAWSPDDTRFVTSTEVTTQGSSVTRGVPSEDGEYAQITLA